MLHLEYAKIGGVHGHCSYIGVCVMLPLAGALVASLSPVGEETAGASAALASAIPSAAPSASLTPDPARSVHAASAPGAR